MLHDTFLGRSLWKSRHRGPWCAWGETTVTLDFGTPQLFTSYEMAADQRPCANDPQGWQVRGLGALTALNSLDLAGFTLSGSASVSADVLSLTALELSQHGHWASAGCR